ncbi:hypothetical protein P9139_11295 [Curtobacterium flaccumfaciens]|nr:hypothetical protein P9139_11295 [Curtobacterium flaccumfaciens]
MGPTEAEDAGLPLLDGRYRLEQAIGQGGMSVVYRAVDESLGRPVAVKVFHPAPSTSLGRRPSSASLRRSSTTTSSACSTRAWSPDRTVPDSGTS